MDDTPNHLKTDALTAYNSENMPEFKRLIGEFIRRLIEMDYILKHCLVNDQSKFDACKMVAEDQGIVNMTRGTPSVLINSAKLLIEELKKRQRLQHPPSKPLPPIPFITTDWSNVTPVSVSTLGWGGRILMRKNHKKSITRCKSRKGRKLTKSK
jgi:hypothetical protein